MSVRRAAKGMRGVVLSVRLTPEQFDALAELARQDGKYVSETARKAIAEYIQRRTSNLSTADMPETVNLSETRFALRYAR